MVFLMRREIEGRMRRCCSRVATRNPCLTSRSNRDRSKSYPCPESVCTHKLSKLK